MGCMGCTGCESCVCEARMGSRGIYIYRGIMRAYVKHTTIYVKVHVGRTWRYVLGKCEDECRVYI